MAMPRGNGDPWMTEAEADELAKRRNAALPRRTEEYWVPVLEQEPGRWKVELRSSRTWSSFFRSLWEELWPFGSSIRP